MKKLFTLLFISLSCTFVKAQVVINEYSCSNLNSYLDAFNQYEDWVELYNAGGTAVNLSGYWLSDDVNDIQKYQIPAGVTINPGARRMVFCSDRDVLSGTQIHTSFKLKQTYGEKFVFADPAGNIIDSTSLFLTYVGHSRGRTTDGAASWSLFTAPTPNAANAGAQTAYATKPIFNVGPGNYTTPQSITITSPDPGVTIRYTTDGSIPTATSTAYAGPINVAATTVIRARAFSSTAGIVPSFVETNTYLINETTTVNVLSISGPMNALFTSGQQQYTCVEYFDKTHTFRYEAEGQMRRHGNDSWNYPQKGFRFHVRDESGITGDINYPLFTTTPKDTFGVILIKAAGSDNFNGGPPRAAHLRDAFAQTLAEKYNLEMDFRRYEPTIVYINGQYWGLYEIRERVDDAYTEYNYNQPEKRIDMLRYWGGLNVEYGSDTGWNNLYNFIMANNMAIPANYAHVKSYLNVNSFIQYFIFNQYLVNTDWLNWNTMWWRGRKGAGVKWRYILWDEDNILNLGQNYTGLPSGTGANNDPCDPMSLFQNNSNIKHTDMLVKLLQNPDFDHLYKQTWIDMLNGVFKCENMLHHFDSIHAIITPEMPRQCTRWGAPIAQWQNNIQFARQFIIDRCAFIQGKIDTCLDLQMANLKWAVFPPGVGEIDMDGDPLTPLPGQRLVMADTTHVLQAFATAPNYIFSHWVKMAGGNTFIINNTDNPVTYDFNVADSITAVFIYHNPDTIEVTFDVDPAASGIISLNGTPIPTYPTTLSLNKNITYTLTSTPIFSWGLVNWEKKRTTSAFAPNDVSTTVSYTFSEKDTVIAHFEFIPDPDSIYVTFKVNPENKGEIILNGNTITSYPHTVKLDRKHAYSLLAQPTVQFHRFVNWEKTDAQSMFAPNDTLPSTTYTFENTDTVIAHFVSFPDPDSIYVVFDVYPRGSGTIDLNGDRITAYPYKVKLYRQYAYDLIAKPIYDWKFTDWTNDQISSTFMNNKTDATVVYRYDQMDSVVANFAQLPPPVDETVMIPSVFSPNGDGTNDVFRIIPGKDVKGIDMKILNRFGEVVFQTNDFTKGWDGYWKGQPADIGTFFYQIKVDFDNAKGTTKTKLYKGDLTLVR